MLFDQRVKGFLSPALPPPVVRRDMEGGEDRKISGPKPPSDCILNVAGTRYRTGTMVRMVDVLTELNKLALYPLNECRLGDPDPINCVECAV